MQKNSIIDENRRYQERHTEPFKYNLQAICQDIKEQEYRSN
jgi:hypothetical protein